VPPEAEDGLLTAEDVTGLDLLDTDLVVLSACETGVGEVHVGEGVMGLRRAFILAGARTVVFSLWKVPDLPTAVLMERFYTNLLYVRLGRDEALREAPSHVRDLSVGQMRGDWLSDRNVARLTALVPETGDYLDRLRRQADDHRPFADPYHWGAFICQGDPGPLAGGRGQVVRGRHLR
jgi:CHAT domain-containing protein